MHIMTPLSMGTARARETHDMGTIRIGDLLDLSSPRAPSTSPGGEPPRSTSTVHHRPEGYQQTEEHRQGNRWPTNHVAAVAPSYVKMETAHGKCPNVLVRNGVMCTPFRGERTKKEVERREERTENMREQRTQETSKYT